MHAFPHDTGWIEVICGSMFSGKNSRNLRPVINRAAIFAIGTPVAFDT